MTDRKYRHTLSAAAWVAAFLCSLALLEAATSIASHSTNKERPFIGFPVLISPEAQAANP